MTPPSEFETSVADTVHEAINALAAAHRRLTLFGGGARYLAARQQIARAIDAAYEAFPAIGQENNGGAED